MHLTNEQLVNGNPGVFWCYGDEDMVRICGGNSRSVHPRTSAVSVIAKWLLCVFDDILIDPDLDFEAFFDD